MKDYLRVRISFYYPVYPLDGIKPVIKTVSNIVTFTLSKASKVDHQAVIAFFKIVLGVNAVTFVVIPDTVDK